MEEMGGEGGINFSAARVLLSGGSCLSSYCFGVASLVAMVGGGPARGGGEGGGGLSCSVWFRRGN